MKKYLTLLPALTLSLVATARTIHSWDHQKEFDKADLVVVATPLVTKDASEPNARLGAWGIRPGIKAIGISTEFEVSVVMKGDRKTNRFVLHHYRLEQHPGNGPNLVEFDHYGRGSFLLFLSKEPDGRYAPVTGQFDPALFSVTKLQGMMPSSTMAYRLSASDFTPGVLAEEQPRRGELSQPGATPRVPENKNTKP